MPSARSRLSPLSLFMLLLLVLAAAPSLRAQYSPSQTPPSPVLPSVTGKAPSNSDPILNRMKRRMAIKQNNERQQKIVTDSALLLALAQKLNAEVTKSDNDTLSVFALKEAGEIQKLAKSIKDKMSNGY